MLQMLSSMNCMLIHICQVFVVCKHLGLLAVFSNVRLQMSVQFKSHIFCYFCFKS